MAKKKLKEKIELTIFWLGVFCLTYLLLGVFLKSDLNNTIDSSGFYDVLRDSLTLAVALLAPIAAFILFTDWRIQHNAIKNEKNSESIITILQENFKVIYQLTPKDLDDLNKFDNFYKLFNKLIVELNNRNNSIVEVDKDSIEFKQKINHINNDLSNLWATLSLSSFYLKQLNEIALENNEFSNQKKVLIGEEIRKYILENQKTYEKIQQQIKDLTPINI